MRPARSIVAGALWAACSVAWAQQQAAPAHTSPLRLLAQALVSLAIVVGIIYLAYFGLRRISQAQPGIGQDGPMQVVQARHLGGDRWLYLVRVGGRTLLVGGGPGQVGLVADLGEADGGDDDEARL